MLYSPVMALKIALLVLLLAVLPLFYVNTWMGLGAAVAAYALAAKLATRHMDRVFLVRSLKVKRKPVD